jgi:hypothetical protein
VVSAVKEEFRGVQPLVGVQRQGDLSRPGAAVNKIAIEEEGVLFCGVSSQLEDVQEIEELAYGSELAFQASLGCK